MRRASIRFEVSINGTILSVAGVEEFGVLSAIVGWVKRSPDKITGEMRAREGFSEDEWLEETIDMNITSLDSPTDKHFHFLAEPLKPGDVVTIRVLEEGEYDAPK